MDIKIYSRLFDFKGFIVSLIFRLIIILILISAGLHFNENPIVITIIILAGLIIIFRLSIDRILLLSSLGFVIRKTFFGIWNISEIIEYSEIDKVIYTGNYTLKNEIIFDLLPPDYKSTNPNLIIIKLKDGSLKKFPYYIFKNKIKDFVDLGNKLINEKKPAHNKSS